MASSWRGRLRHFFRQPLQERSLQQSTEVGGVHAAAVVDLALRAAELGVQAGALTSEATAFALTVGSAYGLEIDVDVTWTSITISYHHRGKAEPITGFRSVRQRAIDYTQLAELGELIDDVALGNLGVDAARERLDVIRHETRPYRTWVVCLGAGLSGAGVAAILGGRAPEMMLAGIANMLLYLVKIPLLRTQLSVFFIQAIAAAVPTTIALAVMELRSRPDGWLYPLVETVSPSLIVAAGIVALLAGTGIVAAARDALDGNLLTASAGTFDAVIQTGGIVVGVVMALWVGFSMGVEGYIVPTSGWASPSPWQMVWAAMLAVGLGFSFQMGLRAMPVVAVLAAFGYAANMYSQPLFGSWVASIALGAFVVGFTAQLSAERWRVPVIALVTCGTVSMMPGSMLYRGIFETVINLDGPLSVQAQITLTQTVLVGVALAAGSALGGQVARPLSLPSNWIRRKAALSAIWRPRRSQTTMVDGRGTSQ